MRLSSGCVETVALYEVDPPDELVRVNYIFIELGNMEFNNALQIGKEVVERKGEDDNHQAEYFSFFMSTISRRDLVPGAL